MRTTIGPVSRSAGAALGITLFVAFFSGCGGAETKSMGVNAPAGNEATSAASRPSPAPTSEAIASSTAPSEEMQKPDMKNSDVPAANVPKPQLGTGASDFFLFTQARAALSADAALNAANIVIDVKAGVLTLNGGVASAELKSKAEQLVRDVSGVKSVTNKLRILK